MIKKGLAVAVILLFIGVAFAPSINVSSRKEMGFINRSFITFPAHLDIDIEDYNERLLPDLSISLPITITYWVEIPDSILHSIPWIFKNLLLYGTIFAPLIEINLSLWNVPEWCHAYISTPRILVDVDNEPIQIQTNLILSVRVESPSEPFTLTITGESSEIKRIEKTEARSDEIFIPEFNPNMQISTENQSVLTPPNQLTIVPFYLVNFGNALTRVNASIETVLDDWFMYITPEMYIPIDYTVNMMFMCIPPADFNGSQSIDLRFHASHWRYPDAPEYVTNFTITTYYPEPPI